MSSGHGKTITKKAREKVVSREEVTLRSYSKDLGFFTDIDGKPQNSFSRGVT